MNTTLKGQAYKVSTLSTIGLFCSDHAEAYLGSELYTVTELDGVQLCDYEDRTERAAICNYCGVALI
jgi:hypothetical protein